MFPQSPDTFDSSFPCSTQKTSVYLYDIFQSHNGQTSSLLYIRYALRNFQLFIVKKISWSVGSQSSRNNYRVTWKHRIKRNIVCTRITVKTRIERMLNSGSSETYTTLFLCESLFYRHLYYSSLILHAKNSQLINGLRTSYEVINVDRDLKITRLDLFVE